MASRRPEEERRNGRSAKPSVGVDADKDRTISTCRTVDRARACSDNAAPAGMGAAVVDEDVVEREATVDCANAVPDDRERSSPVATS